MTFALVSVIPLLVISLFDLVVNLICNCVLYICVCMCVCVCVTYCYFIYFVQFENELPSVQTVNFCRHGYSSISHRITFSAIF